MPFATLNNREQEKAMKAVSISLMLVTAGSLLLGACESKVKVDERGDTTAAGVNGDSAVLRTDTHTTDTAATRTGNMMDSAGSSLAGETIEKKVEAKLVLEPGFSDVDVASPSKGVIVLTGTAATKAEMLKADSIAKATDGVTDVQNKIVVSAAK